MYQSSSASNSSDSLLEKPRTAQFPPQPRRPSSGQPPPLPKPGGASLRKPTTEKKEKKPKKPSFAYELRHEDATNGRLYSDFPLPPHPNYLTRLFLLVFLSIRPRRLRHQLQTEDPVKVWTAMRVNSLVKRWASLTVTSGLMIAAGATMTPPTSAPQQSSLSLLEQLPYTLAIAARCSAIIAVAFGTGLSLIFSDADPRDFVRLAQSPIHLVSLTL
ncbi:hypothetical protein T439DRAFT_129757 [Meredithblackwellia eburnea MCA 4105]